MGKVGLRVYMASCLLLFNNISLAISYDASTVNNKVSKYLEEMMLEANIPGLSVVLVSKGKQTILNYGYADIEKKEKVVSKTLFELGSCSKAFTALAIAKLEYQGKLQLSDSVSAYIPWFKVRYKNRIEPITILQLLHHTSGIPWNTISNIPQSDKEDALEQTIRQFVNVELHTLPGLNYEYATLNYDVLALIIEKIVNKSFEAYVQEEVLNSLNLYNTSIGFPTDTSLLATGYKVGFLKPRKFKAPVYKGNNAAGYVISNAEDMAEWLRFQIGVLDSDLYNLAESTHQRDETVPPTNNSSYAKGWMVSLRGDGEIYHGGLNPNYSSYISFRPQHQIGVVVLANSNSSYTSIIGNNVMKLLAGEEISKDVLPEDNYDKTFSMASLIFVLYIIIVLSFLVMVIIDVTKGKRTFEGIGFVKLGKLILSLILILPFLYGIYILPKAIVGFSWESTLVWTPLSFAVLVVLILVSIGISYFAYILSLYFPEKNKFKRIAPQILLMSLLSGVSNMVVIILVTSALNSDIEPKYLVFYYTLTLTVYLLGRRFVQVNLIRFTRGLIYELRVKLIDKIFSTSYQKFEKIERGRIYTALNDDVGTIGESTNMFVTLITSVFTAIGAFLYLVSIAFWATMITFILMLTLTTIYYIVSRSTHIHFEEARETRNVFMQLINGMIDGFKEISLRRNKKLEYKADLSSCINEYREKMSTASIRFVNASLVGESVLILILGAVAFAFPRFFPDIKNGTILSFIIILLYLIGPVNAILSSIPSIMRLRIAWNRLQQFLLEIPANIDLSKKLEPVSNSVDSIKAEGLKFQYQKDHKQHHFSVGPIDLEIKKGEILFIIGGNGSGKTTLAKLLTGLYEPDEGKVMINNKSVDSSQLSEYFSTVFSPFYLFPKLYNIDVKSKSQEIKQYLQLMNLEEKVEIVENIYSTINLSGGQRKRLALLQCYLEDSPIYLFDEWAADQDPEYRFFFYRTLLPEMKKLGKIIIAITHDDHYFDVADKVVKMNQGKLEPYSQDVPLISAPSLGKTSLINADS